MGPLAAAGGTPTFDITVKVQGGGVTGQTDSVSLAGPRFGQDESRVDLPPAQRRFLTRDPRIKERKKPGLKRARKAPTYTKR